MHTCQTIQLKLTTELQSFLNIYTHKTLSIDDSLLLLFQLRLDIVQMKSSHTRCRKLRLSNHSWWYVSLKSWNDSWLRMRGSHSQGRRLAEYMQDVGVHYSVRSSQMMMKRVGASPIHVNFFPMEMDRDPRANTIFDSSQQARSSNSYFKINYFTIYTTFLPQHQYIRMHNHSHILI